MALKLISNFVLSRLGSFSSITVSLIVSTIGSIGVFMSSFCLQQNRVKDAVIKRSCVLMVMGIG